MSGTIEREVDFHIPLQVIQRRAAPANSLDEIWSVADFVGDNVPMARRRFRARTIRPEFSQHTRKVAKLHHVGWVGTSRDRIYRITRAIVGPQRIISQNAWRNINCRAAVWSQLAAASNAIHHCLAKSRIAFTVQTRWRTWINPR